MKKYFCLHLKRNFKMLPFILAVTAVMLVGVFVVASGMAYLSRNSADKQRFKIAITGDTDNKYTQLGMAVLQNFDDTRFAMELIELTTDEAKQALKSGGISAYVILPENFIERALYGDVDKVVYVTSAASQNVVSMFKNEITELITDMVVYTEKGTYGINEAVTQNGISDPKGKYMNKLSLEYVDLIFSRSDVLVVDQLGILQGATVTEYYVCSLTVFLMLLFGISFVTVCVKKDFSLNRLLISKGNSNIRQIMSEFGAHFITMLALVLVLLGGCAVTLTVIGKQDLLVSAIFEHFPFLLRAVAVLIMVSAFDMMIFELSGTLVSGVLLHFFLSLGMCYVSGCFYPVYSLPVSLQKISGLLPTGVARELLQGHFTGENIGLQLLGIVIFTGLFLTVTILARNFKTGSVRRWRHAKLM